MMKLSTPLLIALFPLSLSSYAFADIGSDLVTARQAYNKSDVATLNQIAQQTQNDPLGIYPEYWLALKKLEQGDDTLAQAFIQKYPNTMLGERLNNYWLKKLGQEQNWPVFNQAIKNLATDDRDEEVACYAQIAQDLNQNIGAPDSDLLDKTNLPAGCNQLINLSAQNGSLNTDEVKSRIRVLMAFNYLSVAKALAQSADLKDDFFSPNSTEAKIIAIARKGRSDPDNSALDLLAIENNITPEQAQFAWGQLATAQAKKLNPAQALLWYNKANPKALTPDQWNWWLRAAIRQQNWPVITQIAKIAPDKIKQAQNWQYWQGFALQQAGQNAQAMHFFAPLSAKDTYYGILAKEALGNSFSEPYQSIEPSKKEIKRVEKEPSIQRALSLFDIANTYQQPSLREDGRREWRFAMRSKSDNDLIAASEIALNNNVYDMAIYSAERTKKSKNPELLYLAPFKTEVHRYAKDLNIDDAWVYGLIRQESRFINVARSGVGASGLMQLMPATAKWVANKIGMGNSFEVHDIDTNIQLGTWYLKHVLDTLSGQPVLATAAYNAGPSRAKAWQASTPISGIVYAETIPFNETRDYVQKVMANAMHYSKLFGYPTGTLTARMGIVPAKAPR